jgi:DNA-binding transcriptional MerR regulator
MKQKLKPLAPGELAELYGVSVNTFNAWIKPHLDKIGKRENTYYYSVKHLKIIFEILGSPFEEIDV